MKTYVSHTMLFAAATAGDVHATRACLAGDVQIDAVDENGYGVLHRVALMGDVAAPTVRLLFEAGVDTEAKDKVGFTALRWAAFYGHAEVCCQLLDCSANIEPEFSGTGGWTSRSPLASAAENGQIDTFRLLSERGADQSVLNPINGENLTPLQIAVKYNRPDIVRYCALDLGADLAQRTEGGKTLIKLAGKEKSMKDFLRALMTEAAIREGVNETGRGVTAHPPTASRSNGMTSL